MSGVETNLNRTSTIFNIKEIEQKPYAGSTIKAKDVPGSFSLTLLQSASKHVNFNETHLFRPLKITNRYQYAVQLLYYPLITVESLVPDNREPRGNLFICGCGSEGCCGCGHDL